jgi:dTDP-4-dehydrorhamnose 3,5-epimerase
MKFTPLELSGIILIEPHQFRDERGYFFESFHREIFLKNGIQYDFVQDNQSLSKKNVLRGLHFQSPPYEQGKLVRVIKGSALDVVVDIRKNSPTYGKHLTVILNEENHRMLWIPPGFAHGFLALMDETIFYYKCTGYYNRQAEGGIMWNDPLLAIDWKSDNPIVSEKDMQLPLFKDFQSPFINL